MTGSLLMMGAFVLSLLLMILGIVAFKYWRRRDARRSPLHGKKLANLPGQQLAIRINDHGDNLLLAGIVMYLRSEEHTSELQSLMRISYAVFCLKKKTKLK